MRAVPALTVQCLQQGLTIERMEEDANFRNEKVLGVRCCGGVGLILGFASLFWLLEGSEAGKGMARRSLQG